MRRNINGSAEKYGIGVDTEMLKTFNVFILCSMDNKVNKDCKISIATENVVIAEEDDGLLGIYTDNTKITIIPGETNKIVSIETNLLEHQSFDKKVHNVIVSSISKITVNKPKGAEDKKVYKISDEQICEIPSCECGYTKGKYRDKCPKCEEKQEEIKEEQQTIVEEEIVEEIIGADGELSFTDHKEEDIEELESISEETIYNSRVIKEYRKNTGRRVKKEILPEELLSTNDGEYEDEVIDSLEEVSEIIETTNEDIIRNALSEVEDEYLNKIFKFYDFSALDDNSIVDVVKIVKTYYKAGIKDTATILTMEKIDGIIKL